MQSCGKVETLIGPIELDILDHPETRARIVLLGDQHENKLKCDANIQCQLPVYLYLQQLFQKYKGTEPIDFFVETAYDESVGIGQMYEQKEIEKIREDIALGNVQGISPLHGFMRATDVYFEKCLRRKMQCEFKNKAIRFHNSDIRQGVMHRGLGDTEREIIKEIHAIRKRALSKSKTRMTTSQMKFVIKLFEKIIAEDIDFFMKMTKLDKQFKKIDNVLVKQKLRHHLIQTLQSHKPVLDFAIGQIIFDDPEDETLDTLSSSISWAFNRIFTMLSGFMDVYILSRIIRHHMKHVIIFAGAAHTKAIKQFLIEQMGFQTTVSVTSKSENSFQCIDMRNVPQPWFTQ